MSKNLLDNLVMIHVNEHGYSRWNNIVLNDCTSLQIPAFTKNMEENLS